MKRFPTPYGPVSGKQIRAVREFARTGFDPARAKEAIVKAGYDFPSKAFGNEKVRALVVDEMQRRGMSLGSLTKEHKRIVFQARDPRNPDMPDNQVRLRAIEMAYKLHDAFPESRLKMRKETHQSFHFDIKTLERAEKATGEEIIDAEIVGKDEESRLDDAY